MKYTLRFRETYQGKERIPRLTREETEKIQELGGEYFVGDGLGEFGGWYATKAKGYYARGVSENPVDGLRDCKEAKETYVRQTRKQMQPRIDNGSKILSSTEAVTLTTYDYEAGIDHVIFMASSKYPGNPAIFPLYKIMTKAILAAFHRNSELKVIGSDKLRFAMFEDDEPTAKIAKT